MRKHHGFIAMIAVALLLGAACSQSQVLSTLSNVVGAAEIALPVLGQVNGTPPETIAAIERYLVAVGKATAAASDILAGPGTSAEKSARIVQAFAGIASGCNCVPAGTPTQVVNVVNAVSQAVLKFLANFPAATRGVPEAVPAIEATPTNAKELTDIRKRSEAIIGAIERKKK
jgi:hypothetical protein